MLPPERYQLRVLKPLLSKIEQAIEDPEEDVGILTETHLFSNEPTVRCLFSSRF